MARKRKQVRRSPDEWERIVEELRASGQSQRAFAQSRGLNLSSLSRWSRLLRQASVTEPEDGGLIELVAEEPRVPLEIVQSEGARLLVGASVCLELPSWPSPDYVALIARAYEAVSPC